MENVLANFVKSENFGSGIMSPSSYATAWAARLRDKKYWHKPAFESSLNWLRENQNYDGSWGTVFPFLIYDRILCTMNAIIALKQWEKNEQDKLKYTSGYQFLKENISVLLPWDKMLMTVGFELIFPKLFKECVSLGFEFDEKEVFDFYNELRDEKISKISKISSHGQVQFNSFLYSAEGLEPQTVRDLLDNKTINEETLVRNSNSSTCFAIYERLVSEKYYDTINEKLNKNNGFLMLNEPILIFDLSFSIHYLTFVGFELNSNLCEQKLDFLENVYQQKKVVGYYCESIPDADETSICIAVLKILGR